MNDNLAYESQKNSIENTKIIKEKIQYYWHNRSASFALQREQELQDDISNRWMAEIEKYIPKKKPLRILDAGTGTGYFAILLAKQGHHVTGIDLTPSMIEEAKKLAKKQSVHAEFLVMDAENPEFKDESFDMIISRNLTWTLPHPKLAYERWCNLLKTGGILLNFDADYGNEKTTDFSKLPENHAHKMLGRCLMAENDAIKADLSISDFLRPLWDIQTLMDLHMEEIRIDTGVSRRIYPVKDAFYNPTPLFALCCVKS